jgi:hypothetical protein
MTTKEIGAAAAFCPGRERRLAIRFGPDILQTRVPRSSDGNMQPLPRTGWVLGLHTERGGIQ